MNKTIWKGGMVMMENINLSELPMGFGMALAKNNEALTAFASMSKEQQQTVIEKTHDIRSKQEMQQYVNHLTALG